LSLTIVPTSTETHVTANLVTQSNAKGYLYFDNKISYLSTQYAEYKVHEIRNQPLTCLIFGTLPLVSGSKTHNVLENMYVFKCKAQQKNLSWWNL